MEEDISANIGFIMGNNQRERVIQILGSKGIMAAERIAKFEHIPLLSVKRTLEELSQRQMITEKEGGWGLTEFGLEIEKEMKKRA
jgi:Mn-dependent DtxR family transcriptional regulator